MGEIIVTQEEVDLLKQKNKQLYSKIEVTDLNLKVLKSIESVLVEDSLQIDAESDVRRSYTATLIGGKDSLVGIGHGKLIWLNRRIRPYIGYMNQRTKKIQWYLLGTFAYNDVSFTYDSQTNKINVNCNDLMTMLNGVHSGEFEGLDIKIPPNTNAKKFFIDTLETIGIKNYYIEGMDFLIPNELSYNVGTTIYTIFKDIIDLYGGYEMFFDINGIFIVQPIPTNEKDTCVADDSLLSSLVLSEGVNIDLSQIYNHIIVYGMAIDPDFYSETVTYSNNIYNAIVDKYSNTYINGDTIGLRIPSANYSSALLNINGIGAKQIVLDENNALITNGYFAANEIYVFRYRILTDDFIYVGQYQCVGEAWDENPESPFNINNMGYEKLHQLDGENYAKIYTNDLCRQRAEYELYKSTSLQYKLNLDLITIPWLDVNKKIEYTLRTTGEKSQYIIKSISGSFLSGTMSITANKFYSEYPFIAEIKGLN